MRKKSSIEITFSTILLLVIIIILLILSVFFVGKGHSMLTDIGKKIIEAINAIKDIFK
jgi:uncharacterized protein (UPF0333 family)